MLHWDYRHYVVEEGCAPCGAHHHHVDRLGDLRGGHHSDHCGGLCRRRDGKVVSHDSRAN